MGRRKKTVKATAGDKKAQRMGRNFNFWANAKLAEAFEKFVESLEYDTTFRTHLEKALKEYLERRGFWPLGGSDVDD